MVYKSAFDNVIREIAIMKKLNHQNICRIYEIINDPKDPNIYLGILIHKYFKIVLIYLIIFNSFGIFV